MKKLMVLSLTLSVALLVGFWGQGRYWGASKKQPRYRLATVEKRDMVISVSATGALRAVVTVAVGSEVSGQVKELQVDFNSPVQAGQVIARIDPESYETLVRQAAAELAMAQAMLFSRETEIQRYRAEVETAQANLAASQEQVNKDRATLANAERNLARQKALVDQDFVSKNEYDKARTDFDVAASQLEQSKAQAMAARSKVSAGKAGLAVAQAQIQEAAANVRLKVAALDKRNVDLENTIIRSPVDGVVIDRSVDVGQTVAASLQAPTLFTIAQDLSKMQVSTSVDEADIGRVKEGQSARFTVDAFGARQFEGSVEQIRKMGKTVQNVVTYEVIISADNTDLSLMPGMTADVQIELLKKAQVLTVPNAALRFTPPKAAKHNGEGERASPAGDRRGGRPDIDTRVQRYTQRLNLSGAQADELRKIFQQSGQKMRAAAQSGGAGGPGEMSALREKIRKETQAAVFRILDAEQRRLFAAIVAEDPRKQGTLWHLDPSGRPVAVEVRVGVSDASHTEVAGAGVVEGMEIIVDSEQG